MCTQCVCDHRIESSKENACLGGQHDLWCFDIHCNFLVFPQIDPLNEHWLHQSIHWSEKKENILFIHGYAAGDNSPPTLLMRDAFIQNGQYNFFMVDYGPVSRAPCYVSLVQNIQYVSNCVASYLKAFFNSGMPKKSITCIGHSMGAHGCGLLKRYLGFRINKIIGENRFILYTCQLTFEPKFIIILN